MYIDKAHRTEIGVFIHKVEGIENCHWVGKHSNITCDWNWNGNKIVAAPHD